MGQSDSSNTRDYSVFKYQDFSELCIQCLQNSGINNKNIEFIGIKKYNNNMHKTEYWSRAMYKCDKNHLFYTDQSYGDYIKTQNVSTNIMKELVEKDIEIMKLKEENTKLKELQNVYSDCVTNQNLEPSAPTIPVAHCVEIISDNDKN
jgi:hypothetical protein